jgi:hypothetical protein
MRTWLILRAYDPQVMRAALRLALVVMFVALGTLGAAPGASAQEPGNDGGGTGGNLGSGLATLTKLAVDSLIVVGALIMTLGFAFGGVGAQVGAMAGLPHAQATAIVRVAALIGFFLFTVFSVPLANAIIDNVGKFKSNEGIHVPQ